jgi:hypothetical protein
MRKILFLDIDGVLNNEEWFKECAKKGVYDGLNPRLVKMLNNLDCEVVISSSWGCDNGQTWKKLRKKGFNLKVIGYTEHHEIGSDWIVRGNSFKKWLHDNMGLSDYQYAILDDDADMLLEQKEHFVQTDSMFGVTENGIENLKEILNSEII